MRKQTCRSCSTCRAIVRRISRASSACSRWSVPTRPSGSLPAHAFASTRAAATPSRATISPAKMAEETSRVPVLTEIVGDARRTAPGVDAAMLEALARELERAVLSRLGPEVDRLIEERLGRTLNKVLGLALDAVRAELTVSVTQMVREAVAASVAHALALPDTTTPK